MQQYNSWLGAPDQPQCLPHWLHTGQRRWCRYYAAGANCYNDQGEPVRSCGGWLHELHASAWHYGAGNAARPPRCISRRRPDGPRCLENHQRLLCLHLLPRWCGLAEWMIDFLLPHCYGNCIRLRRYASCWDCSLKLAVSNNYWLRRSCIHYIVVISETISRARLDVYTRYYYRLHPHSTVRPDCGCQPQTMHRPNH